MEKSTYSYTPNNTLRLYIPVNKINLNSDIIWLLSKASIWKGFDSINDEYVSWEFECKDEPFLEKFVETINDNELSGRKG